MIFTVQSLLATALAATVTTTVKSTTTVCVDGSASTGGASFKPIEAVCVLVSAADSTVKGNITISQTSEDVVTFNYNITGNDPNAERGFHIHAFGDLTDGCASTGSHYNPFNKTHGHPDEDQSHLGDLPMIKTDGEGTSSGSFENHHVKLNGEYSVLGRALVVHAGVDDYGEGGDEESKKTGNAGGRKACCIIGLRNTA